MKKFLSIIFLSLFLFNIVGYYFLFLFLDAGNRNEMQGSFGNESSLQTIRIAKSELKDIILKDDEHEISIDGEMYDVQSSYTDGDHIVFKCLSDKKESLLATELDSHVKGNTDTNTDGKKQNDLSKKQVKDLFFLLNCSPVISSASYSFSTLVMHGTMHISELPAPPPEIA